MLTEQVEVKIRDSVRSAIAELTSNSVAQIRNEDRLRLDLGLDSLQEMELVSRLTEEYDVDPEMEEILAVETVADVQGLLGTYVGKPH